MLRIGSLVFIRVGKLSLKRNGKSIVKRQFVSEVPVFIQSSLESFHTTTGLPWWATFCSSTILARAALFPLVRFQLLASRKLGVAMPEINFLFQLLRQRLSVVSVYNTREQLKIVSIFHKGLRACFTIHGVSIAELLAYPALNISVFISFVYSLRDMVNHGDSYSDFADGGILWFEDLASRDATFVLPLSALGLSYLAMEVGFGRNPGKAVLFIKDFLQSVIIFSLPAVAFLPAGIFCYWIPSSLFGISQTFLLRNSTFQRLMRIPPPVVPPHLRSKD